MTEPQSREKPCSEPCDLVLTAWEAAAQPQGRGLADGNPSGACCLCWGVGAPCAPGILAGLGPSSSFRERPRQLAIRRSANTSQSVSSLAWGLSSALLLTIAIGSSVGIPGFSCPEDPPGQGFYPWWRELCPKHVLFKMTSERPSH